jgi:serine/threonine-protein kinase PpkA
VRAAVQINSEITARAVKGALKSKLSAMKDLSLRPRRGAAAPEGLPHHAQDRRRRHDPGVPGRARGDGLPVVLKVLDASGQEAGAHLSRFIQEYALLSQIDHPNVIKIYDQGFTDDHAYIAMEYFERGDLRSAFSAGLPSSACCR